MKRIHDKAEVPIDFPEKLLERKLGPARFTRLIARVLSQPDTDLKRRQLESVWKVWVGEVEPIGDAASVEFYEDRLDVRLEQWPNNPVERRLLYSFDARQM